jgi:hypothetical protein
MAEREGFEVEPSSRREERKRRESRGEMLSEIEGPAFVAEREGFEPPIPVKVCLISSQVHSTGLCHLSALGHRLKMQPSVRNDAPTTAFQTTKEHRP